jgi:hypothetical protein
LCRERHPGSSGIGGTRLNADGTPGLTPREDPLVPVVGISILCGATGERCENCESDSGDPSPEAIEALDVDVGARPESPRVMRERTGLHLPRHQSLFGPKLGRATGIASAGFSPEQAAWAGQRHWECRNRAHRTRR